MIDDRGPEITADLRDLLQRNERTAAPLAHRDGQLREIGTARTGFRCEPHHHLARLVVGIDPVTRVEPGECGTDGLRHLTHADPHRPGESAVDLHGELRFLPLGAEPHVHRARCALERGEILIGHLLQGVLVVAPQFQRDLLFLPRKIVGEHRHRGPADLHVSRSTAARVCIPLAAACARPGLELEIHARDIHGAAAPPAVTNEYRTSGYFEAMASVSFTFCRR